MKPTLIAAGIIILQVLSFSAKSQDLSPAASESDFKLFVKDFEENFAYTDRPDKPWLTWELRYADAVAKADSLERFDAVLASALSELHDFHAEVRSPLIHGWLPVPTADDIWAEFQSGKPVVEAVRPGSDAERAGVQPGDQIVSVGSVPLEQALTDRLNADAERASPQARQWALLSVLTGQAHQDRIFALRRPTGTAYTVELPRERRFDRPLSNLSTSLLSGQIGYVRFNNSLGNQTTVGDFDRAILQFRGTQGIILDLRDVPSGGDSSVALGIMGRFIANARAYQRHRIPNYGQHDVERNWVEFVSPRGPFTYTAPVVVLVDHWTGSMGEGIAIGFDAMRRAVIIGTPMAHLAGAVSDFKLPQTGAEVAFATEQIYHVNGTPRESWLPRIIVKGGHSRDDQDAILEQGLTAVKNFRLEPLPNDLTLPERRQR